MSSNTYRALTPDGEAVFEPGVFERDFTVVEERDWLASGLIELVPRTYRALSDNYAVPQGETFEAALLVEHEAALIFGGHIERVTRVLKGEHGPELVAPSGSGQVIPHGKLARAKKEN